MARQALQQQRDVDRRSHRQQFTPKQHYYVGGNTKFYGAILFRLRERDFQALQHVDGTSPAWPLSYEDFAPYYTRAEHLYHVHGQRGVDPSDPPSADAYRYPALSHEPRIAQLEHDLTGAGLDPFPLPVGIILDEERPQTSPCIRCATCDGYPCLVNGKADAQTCCVMPALRHPNVSLRTRSRVTASVPTRPAAPSPGSPSSATASGSSTRPTSSCSRRVPSTVRPSCSRSANDQHPQGLGNGSGVVGRHLMMHNNSSFIAFSKIPNPTKFQKTLGINNFYFGDPLDPDYEFPLGGIQMNGKSEAVLIGFDAPEADDPADLARHAMDFWLTTEDLPRGENRVLLDRNGNIRLRYTPTNLAEHQRLTDRFRGLLSAMRCRDDILPNYSYRGGRLGVSGVAHQNGTVRFGHDPATSALDVNCKMHELDNLYVADSSFFPSSAAVNPTLTIIANALRVADVIRERLGLAAVPAQRDIGLLQATI